VQQGSNWYWCGVDKFAVGPTDYSPTKFAAGAHELLGQTLGNSVGKNTTQLLAVSVDSKFVQRRFADHEGIDFPVLADFWPHGEVAQAYGVFDSRAGAALRGSFVIDRAGVVRWNVLHGIPDARDPADYVRALASLT